MPESLKLPMHEPEIIEFLEIGAGREPGTSMYNLSASVRDAIDKGASTLTVDREREGLDIPRYGAVRNEAMQTFAHSDYLRGRVKNIFVNNVCGERDSGIMNDFAARNFFSGLAKKLTPDGKIIVVENYTPSEVAFLKSLDYTALGLRAEITSGVDEYRKKIAELDIAESDTADKFAKMHSTDFDVQWEPFVIVLTLDHSNASA